MADDFTAADLFGDPLPPPTGGRGRPPHVPTRETRNRVLLAFVRGLSPKDAAVLLGIGVTTLREHYSDELKVRATARLRMEMRQLERLNDQAEAGSVSAERELALRLDKLRLRDAAAAQTSPAPAKAKPLGKKEAATLAAMEQRGLYEPPPPPPTTH